MIILLKTRLVKKRRKGQADACKKMLIIGLETPFLSFNSGQRKRKQEMNELDS